CRGCKRFSHEIVAWNTYTLAQRERVWRRLHELRDQAAAVFVEIVDEARMREVARKARIDVGPETTPLTIGYEILRRKARDVSDLRDIGMSAVGERPGSAVDVRDAIDAEFHVRSVAYYEHSFHVSVDS
ncbi:MAG TPA: DUF1289 domain-containing protein, partial [Pseudomonadales bacterium]|nr:DUF1289 domain-containing protein [Pseudomonadales bacterium]